MLIDLVLLAALGTALAWFHRKNLPAWERRVAEWRAEARRFARALAASRLGRLLGAFALIAALQWATAVAGRGWSALDPAGYSGEADEEARCHAWQQRIRKEGEGQFAPAERVCPVGGGPYLDTPQGHTCAIHGAAP